jgi:hypothetical protein
VSFGGHGLPPRAGARPEPRRPRHQAENPPTPAVQRRRRGNLMTTSIFTPTSTTSHSQNPCPPATTQDQADPREPAPTNHCSQAEHARPLINSLPRPEKASEPELDDMSTTGRATSPPDQSLILDRHPGGGALLATLRNQSSSGAARTLPPIWRRPSAPGMAIPAARNSCSGMPLVRWRPTWPGPSRTPPSSRLAASSPLQTSRRRFASVPAALRPASGASARRPSAESVASAIKLKIVRRGSPHPAGLLLDG